MFGKSVCKEQGLIDSPTDKYRVLVAIAIDKLILSAVSPIWSICVMKY